MHKAKSKDSHSGIPIEPIDEVWVEGMIHKGTDWVQNNLAQTISIIASILVLIGGVLGWNAWQKSSNEKAFAALFSVQKIQEDATSPQTGKILNPEDIQAVEKAYQKAIQEHGSAAAGKFIYSGYATFLANHGKFEESVAPFQTSLKRFSGEPGYKAMTLLSLAYVAQRMGEIDLAKNYLQDARTIQDYPNMDLVLFRLGSMEMEQGNVEEAQRVFETLRNSHAQSPFVELSQNMLAMKELKQDQIPFGKLPEPLREQPQTQE